LSELIPYLLTLYAPPGGHTVRYVRSNCKITICKFALCNHKYVMHCC